MAPKTRQRQLRKLAERRAAERHRRRRRRQLAIAVAAVLILGSGGAVAYQVFFGEEPARKNPVACGAQVSSRAGEEKPRFDAPPDQELARDTDYRAQLETSCGTIELDLLEDETPVTVNNFVFLARQGFYDGLTFHRITDFAIQGGDPEGTGLGGPGYEFKDEIVKDLKFGEPGLLAMANPGTPDSNGSQFFITVDPATHLNGLHTIFGEVTEGLDVARRINGIPIETKERPEQTVYIEKVTIEEG